jgi:hypothetical protein
VKEFFAFSLGLVLLQVAPACAETIHLRPAADTPLFEATPTNNLGGVLSLAAGTTARSKRSRALLRFDLSNSIPSNAVVVGASLTLTVVRMPASGGGVNSTFTLHRMLRFWNEGDKKLEANGSPATTGEPTWLAQAHPSVLWSMPGAASPIDFIADPSAETFVEGLGHYEFTGLMGDVERWRSNPTANFGWILISQDELTQATARRFGAREDTDNAAELRIEFQVPRPPPPRIENILNTGAGIRFHFLAQPGFSYTVEQRGSFAPGEWNVLSNFAPASLPRNLVVSDVPPTPARFYRVVCR